VTFEGSCLHRPLTSCASGGVSEGFDLYLRDTHAIEINLLGRALGEIENAAVGEGAAIGDAYDDGFAVDQVRHARGGAEWQGFMRGGHAGTVVGRAVGGAMAAGTVPACEAGFDEDRFAVGLGSGSTRRPTGGGVRFGRAGLDGRRVGAMSWGGVQRRRRWSVSLLVMMMATGRKECQGRGEGERNAAETCACRAPIDSAFDCDTYGSLH